MRLDTGQAHCPHELGSFNQQSAINQLCRGAGLARRADAGQHSDVAVNRLTRRGCWWGDRNAGTIYVCDYGIPSEGPVRLRTANGATYVRPPDLPGVPLSPGGQDAPAVVRLCKHDEEYCTACGVDYR